MSHLGTTPGHRSPPAAATAVALRVTGLAKAYGRRRPVLAGVDLEVPEGHCVAVVGPSGSGKSTLLRIVAGLVAADAGRVEVAGVLTDDPRPLVPPERRNVAFLFQDLALWPHMTVRGNLEFVLEARGVPRSGRPSRVDAATRAAEFPGELLGRRPSDISGGERQRAALARVLAQEPKLLLLDEPLSHLDPTLRGSLLLELRRVRETRGLPALLVTHDVEEAFTLAQTIAVLREGRVEQTGSPQDVYRRPRSRFVAEFLGRAAFLPAARRGDVLATAIGSFPAAAAPAGPVAAVVRPEGLRAAAGGPLRGRVADVVYLADHWLWEVELAPEDGFPGARVHVRAERPAAREEEVRLEADVPSFVPDGPAESAR